MQLTATKQVADANLAERSEKTLELRALGCFRNLAPRFDTADSYFAEWPSG